METFVIFGNCIRWICSFRKLSRCKWLLTRKICKRGKVGYYSRHSWLPFLQGLLRFFDSVSGTTSPQAIRRCDSCECWTSSSRPLIKLLDLVFFRGFFSCLGLSQIPYPLNASQIFNGMLSDILRDWPTAGQLFRFTCRALLVEGLTLCDSSSLISSSKNRSFKDNRFSPACISPILSFLVPQWVGKGNSRVGHHSVILLRRTL